MNRGKTRIKTRRLSWLAVAAGGGLLVAAAVPAMNVPDPGKDFDYVFFGYSAAHGAGGESNRIILAQDVDDPVSPRPYGAGPRYKVVAASPASGRFDGITRPIPRPVSQLFGPQDQSNHPQRFIFQDRSDARNSVTSNSALEAEGRHYLRAVIDVQHNGARTRYTANCPTPKCDN